MALETVSLGSALLLGAMGSTHCIGMCGGIGATLGAAGKQRRYFALCYNLGRIGCYALLGALAGAAVAAVDSGLRDFIPQLGLWLRGIAGLLVIAMGLYVSGWWMGLTRLEAIGSTLWRRVQPLTKDLLPPRNAGRALLLGGAWGLLPCGLVYSSLSWAAVTADPLRSAALMAAFGVGTLPAMWLITVSGQSLRQHLQKPWLRQCAGALLIAFGIATALLPWLHGAHQHGAQHDAHQHDAHQHDIHQHDANHVHGDHAQPMHDAAAHFAPMPINKTVSSLSNPTACEDSSC